MFVERLSPLPSSIFPQTPSPHHNLSPLLRVRFCFVSSPAWAKRRGRGGEDSAEAIFITSVSNPSNSNPLWKWKLREKGYLFSRALLWSSYACLLFFFTVPLKKQESAVSEYRDEINRLSSDVESIPKVEADLLEMKRERNQLEQFLTERNNMLQKVMEMVSFFQLSFLLMNQ
ncbi:hypothetical protein VIGAN_09094600 [Vigna angularis var. angularis]|uniref:Uncharacterized protein n=1 Tax=Vigna angularis var. angularis TaxID=157739 RepID=A0A0S3SX73_PHAAN|nr:hypothetical protein VIGAN_09094600 [Vigna angularis var. angularis]